MITNLLLAQTQARCRMPRGRVSIRAESFEAAKAPRTGVCWVLPAARRGCDRRKALAGGLSLALIAPIKATPRSYSHSYRAPIVRPSIF